MQSNDLQSATGSTYEGESAESSEVSEKLARLSQSTPPRVASAIFSGCTVPQGQGGQDRRGRAQLQQLQLQRLPAAQPARVLPLRAALPQPPQRAKHPLASRSNGLTSATSNGAAASDLFQEDGLPDSTPADTPTAANPTSSGQN